MDLTTEEKEIIRAIMHCELNQMQGEDTDRNIIGLDRVRRWYSKKQIYDIIQKVQK